MTQTINLKQKQNKNLFIDFNRKNLKLIFHQSAWKNIHLSCSFINIDCDCQATQLNIKRMCWISIKRNQF